jgi:hypothetical protein
MTTEVPDINPEELKAAMIAAGLTQIPSHCCWCCGEPVEGHRDGEQLWLTTPCECLGAQRVPRKLSWEDMANEIDLHEADEAFDLVDDLRKAFGLPAVQRIKESS